MNRISLHLLAVAAIFATPLHTVHAMDNDQPFFCTDPREVLDSFDKFIEARERNRSIQQEYAVLCLQTQEELKQYDSWIHQLQEGKESDETFLEKVRLMDIFVNSTAVQEILADSCENKEITKRARRISQFITSAAVRNRAYTLWMEEAKKLSPCDANHLIYFGLASDYDDSSENPEEFAQGLDALKIKATQANTQKIAPKKMLTAQEVKSFTMYTPMIYSPVGSDTDESDIDKNENGANDADDNFDDEVLPYDNDPEMTRACYRDNIRLGNEVITQMTQAFLKEKNAGKTSTQIRTDLDKELGRGKAKTVYNTLSAAFMANILGKLIQYRDQKPILLGDRIELLAKILQVDTLADLITKCNKTNSTLSDKEEISLLSAFKSMLAEESDN